jgi:hypothetical protein
MPEQKSFVWQETELHTSHGGQTEQDAGQLFIA